MKMTPEDIAELTEAQKAFESAQCAAADAHAVVQYLTVRAAKRAGIDGPFSIAQDGTISAVADPEP